MESEGRLERAVKEEEGGINEQRLPHDHQPPGTTASLTVDGDLT